MLPQSSSSGSVAPLSGARPAATPRISDNALLLLLSGAVIVFHILANGQYGFHRDELDIIMNARRLEWGFVAYPPLTPLVARIGLTLFGPSLIGLRTFAALAQGLVVILVGLMARDFGGRRWAQLLAAVAVAIAPAALTGGTLMQYMSFDYLWWVLLSFCTVRLLRSEDPRWWLGIGAAIGLGMMTKYTMAFFVAGLAAAVLLTATRRYLRSPWLYAGAALALLIFVPNLIWQAQHGFISVEFLGAIHARDIEWGRTDGFLPEQLYVATNPFALPLWLAGLVFLFIAPAGKRFRPLGWMFLVTFVLLLVARSRAYYASPAYAMLLAAGAVWWQNWLASLPPRGARWGQVGVAALLLMGAVIAVPIVKPIVPINSPLWEVMIEVNQEPVEMVGWPDLVQQVADVYAGLPAAEKATTAILAGNYGEAGALDLYGPELGLPAPISGANSLWARGYGDPAPQTAVVVGFERAYALRTFGSCEASGQVKNAYDVRNEETTHHNTIFICREPRRAWAEMWPEMQWFQ